jgi:tRNA threonylcarbamoyladenosine biosynthesis protein TsaE
MLRTLGVTENIKSPSFSMVETYEVDEKSFFHVDLFRMQDPNSWKTDEISAAFDDGTNYVFIEWPEKGNDLPAPDIKINIRHNKKSHGTNVRDIAIEINTISTLRNNIK